MRIARAGVGQQHGGGVELRALALVDRHRVDGVDGAEPGRAELDDLAAALERGARRGRARLRRSRRCRRCRAAARSRSRSRAAGGRRTSGLDVEVARCSREPALDPRRPGRHAVRRRGGARTAAGRRRARRSPRAPSPARPPRSPRGRRRPRARGPARAPRRRPRIARRRPGSTSTSSGGVAQHADRRVGVAARGSPSASCAIPPPKRCTRSSTTIPSPTRHPRADRPRTRDRR